MDLPMSEDTRMSTNIPTQPSQQAPLPLLPDLKVIRDTYCSQAMTDKLIRFLQERRPDLLFRLLDEERMLRSVTFDKAARKVVTYLKDEARKDIDIPESFLGILDLMFELSRRLRQAANLPEITILGGPLSAGPDGPFPPLPTVKINESSGHGLSQDLADRLLQASYTHQPRVWFEMAEEIRRTMHLAEARATFDDFLKEAVAREVPSATPRDVSRLVHELTIEADRILHQMCNVPVGYYQRRIKP
jgi:hypothetical protein